MEPRRKQQLSSVSARGGPRERRRETPPLDSRTRRRRAPLALATSLCVVLKSACLFGAAFSFGACACNDSASAYARLDQSSPRNTLDSFVLYWKAGLHDLEYSCLSRAFTQRNGLSLLTYSEGRARLEREQPWLAWFASAKVIAEQVVDRERHVFWIEVGGRTARVNVVREDFARISAGEELLAESPIDLERALSVDPSGEVQLRFKPRDTYRDFGDGEVTSVRAEGSWKIDDFAEVGRETVPRS